MKKNDFFDLEDDISLDDLSPGEPLNIEEIKGKLPTYSSDKLCEMIVCDRYFGCYKEIGVICMEELAARRIAGDPYNFEEYIEKAFGQLPELNLNILPDLGDVLRQVLGRRE